MIYIAWNIVVQFWWTWGAS